MVHVLSSLRPATITSPPQVVAHAHDVRSAVAACHGSDLLRTLLPHLLEQLELCQKSLASYLEAKRALFPRFYFVSDPTLLEVLAQGSDPAAVVQHFQSGLFDSLAGVIFDQARDWVGCGCGPACEVASLYTCQTPTPPPSSSWQADKTRMTEMVSTQGERVRLDKPVDASGMVEAWLGRLVAGMQGGVKAALRRAVRAAAAGTPPADLVNQHPAQAALLAMQWLWTADTQAREGRGGGWVGKKGGAALVSSACPHTNASTPLPAASP